MGKRHVKYALVRWNEGDGRRVAFAGQEVDLPREAEERLDAQGALHPPGYDPSAPAEEAPGPAGAPDPVAASVEDLAAWIEEAEPNAADTVALAGDDPDAAQALLEAEQLAQGGDGRKTVVEPLRRVIEGG